MVDISTARLGSILLGWAHTFNGGVKVHRFDSFTRLHDDQFFRFMRFSRGVDALTGWMPRPRTYMLCWGAAELTGGVLLLIGPRKYRQYSCIALMALSGWAIFSLLRTGHQDDADVLPVPIVCLAALAWNYSAISQSRDR